MHLPKTPVQHPSETSRLWKIWNGVKKRCHQKGHSSFQGYGSKGIQLCPEWRGSYVKFREWALANGYEDHLTLDRIDSKGHYEPANCRWVPMEVNCANFLPTTAVTAWGETKTTYAWSKDARCRVTENCLWNRVIKQGWVPEVALTFNPGPGRYNKTARLELARLNALYSSNSSPPTCNSSLLH